MHYRKKANQKKAMKYTDTKKAEVEAHLPPTQFLYTLDQVAYLLTIEIKDLAGVVSFDESLRKTRKMRAVNILPTEHSDSMEWRVPQEELVMYLKRHNIITYERKFRYPKKETMKEESNE